MNARAFLLVIAATGGLLPTEPAFAQSVAYDNTATYLGTTEAAYIEDGNEVTVAGNDRVITSVAIAVEIADQVPTTVHAQLRLYINDGKFNGSPGTLLWESNVVSQQIEPGGPRFIHFPVPRVRVPNTFIWTAQFFAGKVCFSQFYPPVVGSVRYGYWWYNFSPIWWAFINTRPPFGAIVTAQPDIPVISQSGVFFMVLSLLVAGWAIITRANRRRATGGAVGGVASLTALGFFAWC